MALSGQNGSPIRTRANNRAADRCASALPGILAVLPTQHDPEDRHIVACPTSLAPDGYGVPWGVCCPPSTLFGSCGAACQIGSAHVCTPFTNAHLVCRLLLEKKK